MISILMPVYNGVDFLRESLSSVVSQTFESWELLIGINGYPTNSDVFCRVSEFNSKKIKVLDFPEVKGKPNTLNAMLNYARYDILCLLDVDDIWLPAKLSEQMNYIKDFDVVGTIAQYFGCRDGQPAIPLKEIDTSSFRTLNPIINSSAMLYKKDAHWEDVKGVEDYELWCRLAAAGKKFYNVDQMLVKHRVYSGSAFNTGNYDGAIAEIRAKYGFA
jgi:glycosyltransferase involved in cell wall biosynthesis